MMAQMKGAAKPPRKPLFQETFQSLPPAEKYRQLHLS